MVRPPRGVVDLREAGLDRRDVARPHRTRAFLAVAQEDERRPELDAERAPRRRPLPSSTLSGARRDGRRTRSRSAVVRRGSGRTTRCRIRAGSHRPGHRPRRASAPGWVGRVCRGMVWILADARRTHPAAPVCATPAAAVRSCAPASPRAFVPAASPCPDRLRGAGHDVGHRLAVRIGDVGILRRHRRVAPGLFVVFPLVALRARVLPLACVHGRGPRCRS
jgi:hypothetical protein